MNRTMLSRKLCSVTVVLAVGLLTVFNLLAHPKESMHFSDQAAVFGLKTRGSASFHQVCKAVNGVDSALPNMFAKRFKVKLNANDHRYLGHNLLGGSMPDTSIDYLYNKAVEKGGYTGTRKEFAAILGRMNAEYKQGVVRLTQTTLNLSEKEATSLVEIIHDIHLIGDLTPDNKRIQTIPKLQEIIHDIKVKAGDLPFKDKEAYEKFTKGLQALLDESMKVSERDGSQAGATFFLDEFKKRKLLGSASDTSWGKAVTEEADNALDDAGKGLIAKFRSKVGSSRVVQLYDKLKANYNGKVTDISRRMAQDAGKTFKNVYTPEALASMKDVASTKTVIGTLQEVTFKDGSKKMVLSIPVENYAKGIKAGIGAGVMTFILTEGATVYQFAKGDMTQEDFLWESGKNCSTSMLTGGATFVAVVLGANPTGWVVMGIGVGSYLVCDIAFKNIRAAIDGPGFEFADIMGEFPTELQRKRTAIDFEGVDSLLEHNGAYSVLDYHGEDTIFDNASGQSGLFDYEGEKGLFDF